MKRMGDGPVRKSRHLSVLEAVDGRGNVSQRDLADRLGLPLSQVNRTLQGLVHDAHLEVVDREVRPFAYRLTATGRGYLRQLSHRRWDETLRELAAIRRRIGRRLDELKEGGVRRLVCYGAGEVLDLTLPLARERGLEVTGVVDDDPTKQGSLRKGLTVHRPDSLERMEPEAILVTSFRHGESIRARLTSELGSDVQVVEV